ncbi:polysaccharide deacetylase family protein [bacterium]|nr:polysaccharide deacetylase family protein [bacterium]
MPLARLIALICLITAATPLLADGEIVDALDASLSCLSVDAPVTGARVMLDGGLIGYTPLHLALAPAGLHRIAVLAEGYETWTMAIDLPLGSVTHIDAPLVRGQSTAPVGPTRAADPAVPEALVASVSTPTGPLAQAFNEVSDRPVEPADTPPTATTSKEPAAPAKTPAVQALSELPAGKLWPKYPTPTRYAALTFDDFPMTWSADQLLEILRTRAVRATFFVIGHKGQGGEAWLQQAVADGHTLGNHSFEHQRMDRFDAQTAAADMSRCNVVIDSAVGTYPRFFRPPGGRASPALRQAAASLGMKLVLWNSASEDYEDPPPTKVVEDVLKNCGDRQFAVIALHDGSASTLQALPRIIHELRMRRYRLVTLEELYARIGQ